jgi:phosphatidylinositol glycan class B
MNWPQLTVLIVFGSVAIGISALADKWLYGTWVFPPYNYYYTQMVQNIAAKWGVQPWWYYFKLFFDSAVPPISIVLLLLFFIGIRRKALHVLGICCITFLVGHMLIGHKELRFLFPMTLPAIFFAAIGADKMIANQAVKQWHLVLFKISVGVNIALLLFKMFTPAQEVVSYFKYIYDYTAKQPATLVALEHSPYDLDNLECNFYKSPNADIRVIQNIHGLDSVVNKSTPTALFITQYKPGGLQIPGYKLEQLYCIFPAWLLKMNINNWQERSRIWAIYRISPAAASQ